MNNSLSFYSFPNLFSRSFNFYHLVLSPFDLISFSLFLHAFSTHSINDLSRGYYYFLYFYVIWKISLETNFSGNKVYKHHFDRNCLVTFALSTEIIAGHRLIKCPYISSFSFFQFSFNLFFCPWNMSNIRFDNDSTTIAITMAIGDDDCLLALIDSRVVRSNDFDENRFDWAWKRADKPES